MSQDLNEVKSLWFYNQYGDVDTALVWNTTSKSIRDWRQVDDDLKKLIYNSQSDRKRLYGGGRPIKHSELESHLLVERKKGGSRLTLDRSRSGNYKLRDLGKGETGKYGCIWRRKDRNGLSIQKKAIENRHEPGNPQSTEILPLQESPLSKSWLTSSGCNGLNSIVS